MKKILLILFCLCMLLACGKQEESSTSTNANTTTNTETTTTAEATTEAVIEATPTPTPELSIEEQQQAYIDEQHEKLGTIQYELIALEVVDSSVSWTEELDEGYQGPVTEVTSIIHYEDYNGSLLTNPLEYKDKDGNFIKSSERHIYYFTRDYDIEENYVIIFTLLQGEYTKDDITPTLMGLGNYELDIETVEVEKEIGEVLGVEAIPEFMNLVEMDGRYYIPEYSGMTQTRSDKDGDYDIMELDFTWLLFPITLDTSKAITTADLSYQLHDDFDLSQTTIADIYVYSDTDLDWRVASIETLNLTIVSRVNVNEVESVRDAHTADHRAIEDNVDLIIKGQVFPIYDED